MELMKYKDIFPNAIANDGLFKILGDNPPLEWWADFFNGVADIDFAAKYSERYAGALLKAYNNDKSTPLKDVIFQYYGDKWNRLYKAITMTYEPIENYDRYSDVKVTTERNLTHTKTGTEKDDGTNNSTRTQLPTTVEESNQVSSFDTGSLVDNTKSTQTTNEGEVTDNTDIDNTKTYDVTDADTGTETVTTEDHTHGNIGVTTNQQMLESEFVFRQKYILTDVIYKDIADLCFLKIYGH